MSDITRAEVYREIHQLREDWREDIKDLKESLERGRGRFDQLANAVADLKTTATTTADGVKRHEKELSDMRRESGLISIIVSGIVNGVVAYFGGGHKP